MEQRPPTANERRWAIVRYLLGMAQMFGATFSAVLLFLTGVNSLSLGGVIITELLTTASVLLFGFGRKGKGALSAKWEIARVILLLWGSWLRPSRSTATRTNPTTTALFQRGQISSKNLDRSEMTLVATATWIFETDMDWDHTGNAQRIRVNFHAHPY